MEEMERVAEELNPPGYGDLFYAMSDRFDKFYYEN